LTVYLSGDTAVCFVFLLSALFDVLKDNNGLTPRKVRDDLKKQIFKRFFAEALAVNFD
jgi:hypothetical protein